MRRRLAIIAAGVFVAGGLTLVGGLIYVVVRPDAGGVNAARTMIERVVTPQPMRLVGAGTDQKTPYRDFVVADSNLDQLADVRPPSGYRLTPRFQDGGGPFPAGDSFIVAEWSGPDPRDGERMECMVFLMRMERVSGSTALSDSDRATVEGSDRTLVRLAGLCQAD